MKTKFYALVSALLFLFCTSAPHQSLASISNSTSPVMEQTIEKGKLNKKTLENQLGRKLTIKEKLLLPVVKKQAKKSGFGTASGRSQLVALLLCIFVGGLGIHRFYLGYTGLGILYLFTAGLFGIGWFIDLIRLIIPNGLTPKGQSSY